MDEEVCRKIEEIAQGLECSKQFRCMASNFELLCTAKDLGMERYLKCLEENPVWCSFSVRFGYSYFCRCPVRVYLAKELGK